MATIKNYPFADGRFEDVEVTEEFKREYEKMLADEKRLERKETRRHLSLDMLMEEEERYNTQGILENRQLKMSNELYSLISPELDPLEILIQREEEADKPIVKDLAESLDLTDYQKKIAVEYYLYNKTQTQIAKELGVTRMNICKIIQKVRERVIDKLA